MKLGYNFHPSSYTYPLGHPQLDINIFEYPTHAHYDPERAVFAVVGNEGGLEELTVYFGWRGPTRYRVGVGRVVLYDRIGKLVAAFSFGGELTIANHADHTTCTLQSEAPILDLASATAVTTRLVSEFEGLLAREEAKWAGQFAQFKMRLAQLAPMPLFIAGLASMAAAYDAIPCSARDTNIQQEVHTVCTFITRLQQNDLWPQEPPMLESLLAERRTAA